MRVTCVHSCCTIHALRIVDDVHSRWTYWVMSTVRLQVPHGCIQLWNCSTSCYESLLIGDIWNHNSAILSLEMCNMKRVRIRALTRLQDGLQNVGPRQRSATFIAYKMLLLPLREWCFWNGSSSRELLWANSSAIIGLQELFLTMQIMHEPTGRCHSFGWAYHFTRWAYHSRQRLCISFSSLADWVLPISMLFVWQILA